MHDSNDSTRTHEQDARGPADNETPISPPEQAKSGSGMKWISKVETVRNDPKLRAMEAEIKRLEKRLGQ